MTRATSAEPIWFEPMRPNIVRFDTMALPATLQVDPIRSASQKDCESAYTKKSIGWVSVTPRRLAAFRTPCSPSVRACWANAADPLYQWSRISGPSSVFHCLVVST